MIGWMNNWQYAKDLPTSPWRGQMTFPRSLGLRKTPAGLRLVQLPIDQLARLEEKAGGKTGTVDMVNRWLATSELTKGRAFQLKTEIPLGSAREVGWRILKSDGNQTVISYDRKARKLFFDRTHSGLMNVSKDFPHLTEATLVLHEPVLRLNVLVDRNSVEIFADGGQLANTNLVFPPAGASGIEVYTKGGQAGKISAQITPIQSIWAVAK
jgi:fructan beta-fructosidase